MVCEVPRFARDDMHVFASKMKWLVLFFSCLLFHIAGTWSLPLIDRDEPRFAEAAREMIERGDYIVPYFNNHYRFDKPPLTYWFQTLSYRAFGENDFAARFPSAIAAALVAVVLLAWGGRMEIPSGRDVSPKRPTIPETSDRKVEESDGFATANLRSDSRPYLKNRIGWWAAIIFTLCLQTFMHAKAAVADMWLVLFVATAHWAGWELLRDSWGHASSSLSARRAVAPYRLWWWIFYLSLAFAFLAKGPIGWTPLLTIAAAKLWLRDTKVNERFVFVPGIFVILALVCVWAIPALIRTHGEFFRVGIGHHVVGRSIGTMEGHGAKSLGVYFLTLPFYFITVLASFFPWSIKLPWLTRNLWRERDATDKFLLAGILIIFVIFTLVKTKLPHYTLPAFPLLALLLARHWAPQGAALSKAPMAAVENRLSLIAKPAIITAAIYFAVALFVFPLTRQFFPSLQLFEQSRNELKPEMDFGALSYNEPSLVWYFRSRVNGFLDSALDAESVPPFMDENGARFVIMPTAIVEKIFPTIPTSWKTFRTPGFNIAKGKHVDLTMILKPE